MEGLISTRTFGLIELGLTFGGVLVFCLYQIWTVRRPAARQKPDDSAAPSGGRKAAAGETSSARDAGHTAPGRRGMR